MTTLEQWLVYLVPLALTVGLYLYRQHRRERHSARVLSEAVQAGLTEPPSLHPVVDPASCVNAGACVTACPEKALGIVHGRGHLVDPSVCVGHGACAAACPTEAITLVLGTQRRGIDIPYVKPDFETNVAGIYVAGELGGMGLIRKAAEQGRQAMASIARKRRSAQPLDVVIIGVGPAGISATLAAMQHDLRFVTLEQEDSLGGTVFHYPRHKVVMTQPVTLPVVGRVKLGEVAKEALLGVWQGIVDKVGMPITFGECVQSIEALADGFVVRTAGNEYRTGAVLLAIGRRGTPRRLKVPGEELSKVVYRLTDAAQYAGRKVLVVGGGDSAIEAAVAVAGEAGASVQLSYRGDAFNRVKRLNRERLAEAVESGRLQVVLRSRVLAIEPARVRLEQDDAALEFDNDAVIVCAGGVLPTPMLKEVGIRVETRRGEV